jgi:hypothetical protein
MDPSSEAGRAPIGPLLSLLRNVLHAQAEALGADDFAGLDRLSAERDELVAALGPYTRAEATPEDRTLLDQLGALDQRLLEMARAGREQASHDLRDVHRGRGALAEYGRRGSSLLPSLVQLDLEG